MTVLFTTFSIIGAIVAGANLSVIAVRPGTPLNGASMIIGLVTSIYFAARSHGWAP